MGLNVLAVTLSYPPLSRVGAWMSTHECLRRLVERGHDVRVQTRDPHTYTLDGVRVDGRFDANAPIDADVVVFHHGDRASGINETSRAVRAPRVVMVHGETDGPPTTRRRDLVVWNAEASRANRPGIVVRPHVDLDAVRTTPGDHITLVNLNREKGARVFRRVAMHMRDRKFLGVVGGWGDQLEVRGDNIEIQQGTPNMRGDVYGRTRILLMPSLHETWGRVGVEAMCSGIPVIAHPTPGLRESLGDAGIFVDRKDIGGWVEAIRELDDPDTYRERSEACRERAESLDTAADLDLFVEAIEMLPFRPRHVMGVPA